MSYIDAHGEAVDKVLNYMSQHSVFTNLVKIKDREFEKFLTLDYKAAKERFLQERAQALRAISYRSANLSANRQPQTQESFIAREAELNQKIKDLYDTAKDFEQSDVDSYVQATLTKNYVKYGDIAFKDVENVDQSLRVVAGTCISKSVLKMGKNKLTVFLDPDNVANSKVCRTQTLVRYGDTIKNESKFVNFKNIKNFCLLSDLPVFYVQLSLAGYNGYENTDFIPDNTFNSGANIGISSRGFSQSSSAAILDATAKIQLIEKFFTKVLPRKPLLSNLFDIAGSVV